MLDHFSLEITDPEGGEEGPAAESGTYLRPVPANLINCILANVADSGGFSGDFNGFYNTAGFGDTSFGSDDPPFVTSGNGSYYLKSDSPFRAAGTALADSVLCDSLRVKTTQPPLEIPAYMTISGELTLLPQVPRYAGGRPDLGYHYEALDYKVSGLTVQEGGKVTVEPGTVIGVRQDSVGWGFSQVGMDLRNGSTLTSHGTPNRPVVFTEVRLVQEQPIGCWGLCLFRTGTPLALGPSDPNQAPPVMDCRFCNFHVSPCGPDAKHLWAGGAYNGVLGWNYAATVDAALNLTLRDCNLFGGWVVIDKDWTAGERQCAVSWANNLFDRVQVCVDPHFWYYVDPLEDAWVYDPVQHADMAFEARNNLFHGGAIGLGPIPASAGYWSFKDNLFDKMGILQPTDQPLNFDYNAYWPLTQADLDDLHWSLPDNFCTQLQATDPDDDLNGGHEVVLMTAPGYETGPLGDYYLATSSALYDADKRGSCSVAEAGLYHYTTRVDQAKDGAQSDNAIIGKHYIATASSTSTQPIDTDNDGIPDYVENWHGDGDGDGTVRLHADTETDWRHNYSDGTNPDSLNALYDDVDLDGDGLTGAAERVLSTNPLDADNPLDLSRTGLPPILSGVATISLNIGNNVDADTPITLSAEGVPIDASVYQVDGVWFAQFDTTTIANGQILLSFEIGPGDPIQDYLVVSSTLVNVQNPICFPNWWPVAGESLYVPAQTIYPNGTWSMDVYDDQANLFTSLSGDIDSDGRCLDPATSQPGITVSLLDEDGNQLTSSSVMIGLAAEAPGGGGGSQQTKTVRVERPWSGDGKWSIAYMPEVFREDSNGAIDLETLMGGIVQCVQQSSYGNDAVLDTPDTVEDPQTLKLRYVADWTKLTLELRDRNDRNFVYFGHFWYGRLGGTKNPDISLGADDLRQWLANSPDPLNNPNNQHPYRFVFINGCKSAKSDLPLLFGIPKKQISSADMQNKYHLRPRAFLGWRSMKNYGIGGGTFDNELRSFTETLFTAWRDNTHANGTHYNLQEAVDEAMKGRSWLFTRPVIYGCPDLMFGP